jgi:hypothetical protein
MTKGHILSIDGCDCKRIQTTQEVMKFCAAKGILIKNYKQWMMQQSAKLIQAANIYAMENCGHGITPISTWRTRKEELAHERQKKEQIQEGLIGVWSCMETAFSYRARFCNKALPEMADNPMFPAKLSPG